MGELLSDHSKLRARFSELFGIIDQDGSGSITIGEVEAALLRSEVRAYLGSLGVEPTDAWTLFKLIDSDKTGVIDLEQFVSGCMDLRGGAKAAHLAAMAY